MTTPVALNRAHELDASLPIADEPTAKQNMLQSEQMLEHMRLKKLWDETVQNKAEYVRYAKTVVMMVSWKHSDLNQEEMEKEVSELAEVFEEGYGFEVHQCVIDSSDGPRKKLNRDLSNFVYDNDNQDTLLIVYYAGHGCAMRPEETGSKSEGFMLFDKGSVEASKLKVAAIAWEWTEDILVSAEKAHLLVIFDCCDAGSLCHSRSPARFEYLAACLPGARTKPAGPKSFTRALIWSLRELRDHERGWYPTSELKDTISKAPNFPKDQRPLIGPRGFSPDYIVLAPASKVLDPSALQRREGLEEHIEPVFRRHYLDLRFEFHEHLTDSIFIETGRVLGALIPEGKIGAKRITFIEKHGKSRWRAVLRLLTATSRLRKSQSNGHATAPGHVSAIDTGPVTGLLAPLLGDDRQSMSPSSLGSNSASPSPTGRLELPGAAGGGGGGFFDGDRPPFSVLGRYRLIS